MAPRRVEAAGGRLQQLPRLPPGERDAKVRLRRVGGQVRIATVSQGLEPHIGYVHSCCSGRVVLVYVDRDEPPFDRKLVEALRDETVREATRAISRLPERERRLVLEIVQQFREPDEVPSGENSG
jgi:hypothetical protein